MISKELLSEVMGVDVMKIGTQSNNDLYFEFDESAGINIPRGHSVNIYHLAHKCKEWLLAKGYGIDTFNKNNSCIIELYSKNDMQLFFDKFDNFNDGIFATCQWELDNEH